MSLFKVSCTQFYKIFIICRSYEVPKRDEEAETLRKARAKRARETRRSTQVKTCFSFYVGSETQRKARTKRARETRRSTQVKTCFSFCVGSETHRKGMVKRYAES